MSEVVGPSLLVPTAASSGGSTPASNGDPYWANVVLLLQGTGTNGSTSFPDSSISTKATTVVSAATISTTQSKWGGGSMAFNTSNNGYTYTTATSSDFIFTGDFTIETWVYIVTGSGTVYIGGNWVSGAGFPMGIQITTGTWLPQISIFGGSPIASSGTALTRDAWHHVAVSRVSGVIYVVADGAIYSTTSNSSTFGSVAYNWYIESWGGATGTNGYWNANDYRITKGVGRYYPGNLTPPTAQMPTSGIRPAYGVVPSAQASTGAWTYINSTRINTNASGTRTLSATSLTAGNHIFVFVGSSVTLAASTISDTAGNTYTAVVTSSGNLLFGKWYYCLNANGNASNVVTITAGSTTVYGAASIQFSKSGSLPALNAVAGSLTGSGTAAVTCNKLTSNMGGLLLNGFSSNAAESSIVWSGISGLTDPFTNDSVNRVTLSYKTTSDVVTDVQATATGAVAQGKVISTLSVTDVVTSSFDPFFSSTVLLLHCDGTNASTTFTDLSAYARTMTRTGGPTISTTQSKFGGASMLSSGTGRITTPTSPDFYFGTGDFTLEFWLYAVDVTTAQAVFGNDTAPATYIYLWNGDINNSVVAANACFPAGSTIVANTWNHIALSRKDSVLSCNLNGVCKAYGTNTNITGTGGVDWYSWGGRGVGPSGQMVSGNFIDEIRITKGVGRYTGDFAAPTYPYASVVSVTSPPTGVVLLLHCEGTNGSATYTDSSASVHTFTAYNAPTISTAQSALGASSISFPAGAYLLSNTSTDFDLFDPTYSCTVEFFVYKTSSTNSSLMQAVTNSTYAWDISTVSNVVTVKVVNLNTGATLVQATGTPSLSTTAWVHIAAVLNVGVLTVYVGGVGGTPATLSTSMTHGTGYVYINPGATALYMDEVRITKGTAVYTSNFIPQVTPSPNPPTVNPTGTVLLLHFESLPIVDSGSYALTVSNGATPLTLSSTVPLPAVGTYSGYFGGTTFLELPAAAGGYSTGWNRFTSGVSGTVQFWMCPSTVQYGDLVFLANSSIVSSWCWGLHLSAGVLQFLTYSTGSATTVPTKIGVVANVWTHVALVNNAGTLRIYINGAYAQDAFSLGSSTGGDGTGYLYIGFGSFQPFVGNLDELKVTTTADYSAPFLVTVPTAYPAPAPSSTPLLLLHFEGTPPSTTFTDSAGLNAITSYGAVKPTYSQIISKVGSSSAYFYRTDMSNGTLLADIANAAPYKYNIFNRTATIYGTTSGTVEFWLYPVAPISVDPTYKLVRWNIPYGWEILVFPSINSISLNLYGNSGTTPQQTISSNLPISLNQWTHVAIVNNGGFITFFINGVADTTNFTQVSLDVSTLVPVGASVNTLWIGNTLNGYLDELRISSTAVYTTNFTPPTTPLS